MKGFVLSTVFVVIIASIFVVGMATGTIALGAVSFCLWTPAIFVWGWMAARSGLRFVVFSDPSPTTNNQLRQSRIRGNQ